MNDAALSLCMIVKDEGPVLARALNSVSDVATDVVVVDTGSSDDTLDVAHRLGARVFHFDWTGSFADARNFALEQARGEWVLTMDADEELHPEDVALVRSLLAQTEVEAYICTVINYLGHRPGDDVLVDHRISLFRRRTEYRYSRALHETIQEQIQAVRPGARIDVVPLRLLHYGYLEPELERKGKRRRNREILEQQLRATPGDPFLQYALATECMAMGELVPAREWLQAALLTGGPDSHLRSDVLQKLSACAARLGHPSESLAWLQQAVEEFPDYTDLWYGLAGAHAEAERWTEAEACLRLCLALGEAPAKYNSWQGCGGYRAWEALGHVFERKGSPRAALRAYVGCLMANPQHKPALSSLTRLMAAISPREAVRELSQQFNLSDAGTVLALAAALRQAGAEQHAQLVLGRAQCEWNAALHLEAGHILLAAARRLDAKTALTPSTSLCLSLLRSFRTPSARPLRSEPGARRRTHTQ